MQSLIARHPRRLDIPLLLGGSLVLLYHGLTMPALEIRALLIFRDEHSILSNIESLYRQGRRPAALTLAGCSVAYPAAKNALLMGLLFVPFPAGGRRALIRLLRLLGRWSMLDVFAVTAIVVGSRVVFLLEARPLPGIYVYAASIFALMLATVLMDRLARRGHRIRR
jgi:uncharacterized paraquat-inducible protein A